MELNDEVDKLVLQHLFGVEVCYQEGNVVTRNRFSPQDKERLGSHFQESSKLVDEQVLNLVGLLDLDADADRVDARLDQDSLVLVAGNGQGREQHLGGGLGLDLGDIVALSGLGGEVGERQGGNQAASYALEVRPQ